MKKLLNFKYLVILFCFVMGLIFVSCASWRQSKCDSCPSWSKIDKNQSFNKV